MIVGEGEIGVHAAAVEPVLDADEGAHVVRADHAVQRLHPLSSPVRLPEHAQIIRVSDPDPYPDSDPHLFELLDPDPH